MARIPYQQYKKLRAGITAIGRLLSASRQDHQEMKTAVYREPDVENAIYHAEEIRGHAQEVIDAIDEIYEQ